MFGQIRWNWPSTSPFPLPAVDGVARARVMAAEGRMALEQIAVRAHVDHLAEARVRDGAVVALEVVLDGDLPVGVERERHPLVELERVQVEAGAAHDLGQLAERLGERRRRRVGVHEDERPPRVDLRRLEPERLPVEAGIGLRARRCAQLAVEAIGPGVVVALERRAAAAAGDDLGAAVAADVDERAQRPGPLAVADDHQRHLADVQRQVGARFGELAAVARVLPCGREQASALPREHVGIGVPAVGKGVGHAGSPEAAGRATA